jgi:hypothetical protein
MEEQIRTTKERNINYKYNTKKFTLKHETRRNTIFRKKMWKQKYRASLK